jgi:hypothetical protein
VTVPTDGLGAEDSSTFIFLSVAQTKDFLATGVADFKLERAPAPTRFTAMMRTFASMSLGKFPMTIGLVMVPSGKSVQRTPSSTEYRYVVMAAPPLRPGVKATVTVASLGSTEVIAGANGTTARIEKERTIDGAALWLRLSATLAAIEQLPESFISIAKSSTLQTFGVRDARITCELDPEVGATVIEVVEKSRSDISEKTIAWSAFSTVMVMASEMDSRYPPSAALVAVTEQVPAVVPVTESPEILHEPVPSADA